MKHENYALATFFLGIATGFLIGWLAAPQLDAAVEQFPLAEHQVCAVVSAEPDLQRSVNRLQAVAPASFPIEVQWSDDLLELERLGDTVFSKSEGKFIVRVQEDLSSVPRPRLERMVKHWVLLHEWGHALGFHGGTPFEPAHGAYFGLGWAQSYRALYGVR